MEQTLNKVNVVGKLVKMDFEEKVGEKGDYIKGDLILRTVDGSEIEVGYFANKFTKEGKESGLYKGLQTIMTEYVSLEQDKENADVIKIGGAEFNINDYLSSKDSTLKSYNQISAKFANRLQEKEIELNPQTATFEISGVITKLQPEMYKEVPTGNGEVHLDIIGYEGKLIPIKLIIPESLTQGFGSAGFYETGFAKFSGNIINTTEVEEIVEKQSFGADIHKTITKTIKRFEVTGGSPLGDITANKLTQEEYDTCKSKRRLKLDEIKNKTTQTGFNTQVNQPQNTNPFANGQTSNPFGNPFAK